VCIAHTLCNEIIGRGVRNGAKAFLARSRNSAVNVYVTADVSYHHFVMSTPQPPATTLADTLINTLSRQQARVQRRVTRLQQRSDQLVRLRLLLFVAGVVLAGIGFLLGSVAVFWVVATIVLLLFAVTVRIHRRVSAHLALFQGWLRHLQTQAARLTLDWSHIPAANAQPGAKDHPFAHDLDLLGEHSVHQLLNTAVTRVGAQRLADWLTDPQPDATTIQQRQQRVRELVPLAYLRGRLALDAHIASEQDAATSTATPLDVEPLVNAAIHSSASPVSRALLGLMIALSASTIALFVLNQLGVVSSPLWAVPWVMYVALFVLNAGKIRALFVPAFEAYSTLHLLARVFRVIERYRFDEARQPHLRALCAPLREGEALPSALLRRMGLIVAGASLQNIIYLWLPLNLVIPWDFVFVSLLQQAQQRIRTWLPRWLDTWYELEALGSLANHAALNPSACFPQIDEPTTDNVASPFEASALGHPLIPPSVRVCNDFRLSHMGEAALITGSNMSGKSSFLRTLGVNLCLAYAGGPVCARALHTQWFRLFTSIAVSDSVVDGISYFYAEVRRLKRLLDALHVAQEQPHARPLFFLIDEIFRGTNNRERLIGSRSYIRALVGQYTVGAISTHDLELTQLPNELRDLINYHFTEHMDAGRMAFDYRLKPGPSPSTNAVRIMQMEGLPIYD
jgi:hypothetical protein